MKLEKSEMKNKFFFIIAIIFFFILMINLSSAIRDYDTTTATCSYSCDDGTIESDSRFCDYSCIIGDEICCSKPCPSEGVACSTNSECNPGVTDGEYCTGFVCSNNYCCPEEAVWVGGGCTEIQVTPLSQDFGTILVSSCSSEKVFKVENIGDGTLTGTASVSAPFDCISGCDYSLTSGETQTVGIKFCPSGTGIYSRTVSFSGGIGATTTVIGEGIPPPDILYTLTTSKLGTGYGTVTGSGIDCGTTCSKNYENGTSVTLNSYAATGSVFAGWSGACSGTGICTITMDSAKSVTATFNIESSGSETVTVHKNGTGSGTVTSSPVGINCGTDCVKSYDTGTDVTLSASATAGSTFTSWSGEGCSGTGTCELTMSTTRDVTATFTLDEVPNECDLTSAAWNITEVIEGHMVKMNVEGTNCINEALIFDIYSGSTNIETIYSSFPSSSWIATPVSDDLYHFVAKIVANTDETVTSNNLLVTDEIITGGYCDDIILCSNYGNESYCNPNQCNINVQDSVPPTIDCDDPEIDCACIWESSECKASWKSPPSGGEVGTCIYTQDTDDNCDDGWLKFSWTALWVWDAGCDAACQAANADLAATCEDGDKTIECPSQIPLPFFNAYSFIASLVIIAFIYTIMVAFKKKKIRIK